LITFFESGILELKICQNSTKKPLYPKKRRNLLWRFLKTIF